MENKALAYGVLSFIIPGIGQILNGETNKGIKMLIVLLVLNIFIYFFINNPFGHVVSLLYSLYSAHDAYTNY